MRWPNPTEYLRNPTAYHGSRRAFHIVDARLSGGEYGPGIYFTTNLREAVSFANRPAVLGLGKQTVIHECFVDLRNPIRYDQYFSMSSGRPVPDEPFLPPEFFKSAADFEAYERNRQIAKRVKELIVKTRELEIYPERAIRELQSFGFDGILVEFPVSGVMWYAVFNPQSLACSSFVLPE